VTLSVYGARPIKRRRRTRLEIGQLKEVIFQAVSEDRPMTVRQVFYRLVTLGAINKTEREYKSVCRLLGDMRRADQLPYRWITDSTRVMRKERSFSSLEMALEHTAMAYRRSLWDNQNVYVEVWLEKDALSGVLYEVTNQWDVPLMVTRGYPSISFLHEAALHLSHIGKPVMIYYFGDYDPSGEDIPRVVEEGIREFAPDVDLVFERVAVNPSQIIQMGLDTRPTKSSDSRSKTFQGESVELDAIRPAVLRDMTAQCIERHLDKQALEAVRVAEESEREILLIIGRELYP
jgi:hypothetical protein